MRIGSPTWRDWAGGSRAHLVLAAIGIGSPGPMLQGVCEGCYSGGRALEMSSLAQGADAPLYKAGRASKEADLSIAC